MADTGRFIPTVPFGLAHLRTGPQMDPKKPDCAGSGRRANSFAVRSVLSIVNDHSRLSALARAASLGEHREREELIRLFWPNAYRIAWSILGERGAAEDTAQVACMKICAKLRTLADPAAFSSWAYRIVISAARDRARTTLRIQTREAGGYDEAATQVTHHDPGERLDLEAAIGRLSETQRLTLELHYFFGLNNREIGIALGIPAATVRFRLMMARRTLRPLLSDESASSLTLPEVVR